MSKQIKMYPPGCDEPVIPHKSDIKYLESIGWTYEPVKKVSSTKLKDKGEV